MTLRLRGSKTELEEMGEDVTDMATTTSQLQAKLLALTGGQVDIMLDANTFKNSTQILREMASAWKDMNDIQRASALELMGGKRQANVLSALIQNFDTVEEAIEASAGSAGSALKENERYLDSIQGKIDQFTNATQSMWSNFLDADVVKFVVDLGTKLIKLVDTLGLIPSILIAIGAFKGLQLLFKGADLMSFFKSLTALTMGTKVFEAETRKASLALLEEAINTKLVGSSLVEYAIKMRLASTADVAKMTTTQLLGLSFKTLGVAIWGAVKAVVAFLFTNPVGWAILAIGAIAGVVAIFNTVHKTAEELAEELGDLRSEFADLESEIDSLNSELKTTQDRMAELLAMPSLSFIEQEELEELKQTTAELERQVKLKEMLAGSKKEVIAATSEKYIDRVWNSVNADKKYYIDAHGVIAKDSWDVRGENTKDILKQSMEQYQNNKEDIEKMKEMYAIWDDLSHQEKLDRYNGLNMGNKSFGVFNFDAKYEGLVKDLEDKNRDIVEGINMVFADENFDDLEYGQSETINAFLDEIYAYQYKWQQAQGVYVKSDAISSMFDATSTKDMQEFGKTLQEIANSDLTDEEKNAKILEQLDGIDGTIGDGVRKIEGTTDAYNRLYLAMETVGVTAQDIADYFVLETGAFDSNTIEGVANQYRHMTSVMDALKNMSNNKFTFDGIEYNWDEFFSQDDQGKFEANVVKFSEILNGMDERSRETFISIVESAANSAGDLSKIDWNQAIAKLDFSGLDRTFELLNNEFEGLNNEMFAGAADDINGLIDTVSELQAALEDVASTMDLVHTAQTQMNNSGRISTKTALELMQTTEDWDSILEITNGTIKLRDGAEQHLIQTELKAIQTQLHYAWTTAQARYETALAAQGELDYAGNSGIVMTAESIKAEAIGRVSAVVVALGAAMDKLMAGEWDSVFSTFGDTYTQATNKVVQDSQKLTTSVSELQKDAENKKKMYEAFSSVDTTQEFKNNYDFNETPGDKYGEDAKSKSEEALDAFQREMDYWENRIGANQAKYEQLQNEIDLLEAKGQKADASYYEEQIELEQQRLSLLEQQKSAALAYRDTFDEGSEQWWEWANTLNDIESELDDVTSSIVDLQDAIAEIDTYKFEEFNTRLDDITSKLETIRNLIAPDGEENWFDDEGNWTEDGVAVLGAYIQELETYKQGYDQVKKYLDDLSKYEYNDKNAKILADKFGIHSEQEYYDRMEELMDQQYSYAESISDTKQSVVDMYESSIDAVDEYIGTLIDGYNDYIDSVKEALDAERALYDFKKNVQKQAKDISEIERRIASLSGSTNKSDIAERRKLEAQLFESRESLNDTYYDHAKQSQQDALDEERNAYEENMNRFVEGLRTSLEEATLNMDEFLMGVTSMVMYNADTVLSKYEETNLPLTKELTNPWEEAKKAVGSYSGNALDLMNQWTKEGGFFEQFNATGTTNLESPWSAGTTAATNFQTDVKNVMSGVVSNISSNVQSAKKELAALYQEIKDTEAKAASANVTVGGGDGGGSGSGDGGGDPYTPSMKSSGTLNNAMTLYTKRPDGGTTFSVQTIDGKRYLYNSSMGAYFSVEGKSLARNKDDNRRIWESYSFPKGTTYYKYYAKGTTGTTRDEWAITDEPKLGDELVLVPGKDGNLSFMRKGTGVVPADLTANLMEWGQFTPESMNLGGGVNVNMINNAVNKPEFNFAFDALVKAENITEETLPAVKKLVTQELNRFTKELNYALKGKGAR